MRPPARIDPHPARRGEHAQRHLVLAAAEQLQPPRGPQRLQPVGDGLFVSQRAPERRLGPTERGDLRDQRAALGAIEGFAVQDEDGRLRQPRLVPERGRGRLLQRRRADDDHGRVERSALVDGPGLHADRAHLRARALQPAGQLLAAGQILFDDQRPHLLQAGRGLLAARRGAEHPHAAGGPLVEERLGDGGGRLQRLRRGGAATFHGDRAAGSQRQEPRAPRRREARRQRPQLAAPELHPPHRRPGREPLQQRPDLLRQGRRLEIAIEARHQPEARSRAGRRGGVGDQRDHRHRRAGAGFRQRGRVRLRILAQLAAQHDQIRRACVHPLEEVVGVTDLHAHAAVPELDLRVALGDRQPSRPQDEEAFPGSEIVGGHGHAHRRRWCTRILVPRIRDSCPISAAPRAFPPSRETRSAFLRIRGKARENGSLRDHRTDVPVKTPGLPSRVNAPGASRPRAWGSPAAPDSTPVRTEPRRRSPRAARPRARCPRPRRARPARCRGW